jgi:sugar lactone lactonase YvrE
MRLQVARITICLLPVALSCKPHNASTPVDVPPPPPPEPPAEHVPPPVDAEPTPPKELPSAPTTLTGLGLKTPESVLYDPDQDVYFVSNINGRPTDKDDNGFISKVTADGKCELLFIDGGKPEVKLNAPKGLALAGGLLYVADIDRIQVFDAKTGAAKQEIALPGATFINDLGTGPDGGLYATDSGFKPDFSPSGTDAVYKIIGGKPKLLLKGAELGHPNGILPSAGGAWVVTFGSGELYWVSDKGARESVQRLPKGKGDGIVIGPGGRMFISSWEGSSVLAGTPGAEFSEIASGLESPADIGYDSKRNRLLIPLFMKDSLVFHPLDAAAP